MANSTGRGSWRKHQAQHRHTGCRLGEQGEANQGQLVQWLQSRCLFSNDRGGWSSSWLETVFVQCELFIPACGLMVRWGSVRE